MFDNRLFNVNGKGIELLTKTLELAFLQADFGSCASWEESKEHGLILSWSPSGAKNKFPAELSAEEITPIVINWLNSDFAKEVELSDWCGDADHDGNNGSGWQVYVENWGHVGDSHYAICAIKLAFLWYGK